MGVYDYLSVVDWDWNLPRGAAASRPHKVAEMLERIHRQGARFYDAESGDCWGPCGLGYYIASRVLWDVDEAQVVDKITEDFLDKAFGSARAPMAEFYNLITHDTQRRSPSDLVGRMYRHLAAGRAATTDERVLRRIDDLTLYTRHAELMYAHQNGNAPMEEVARHAYRMRKSMMVHSYGLWARLLDQRAAAMPDHPLKTEEQYGAAEAEAMTVAGIARNQPVEPGFEGVEFTKDLIPAMPRLKLSSTPRGSFPAEAQDRQRYHIWLPAPTDQLEIRVKVKKVWAQRQPRLETILPA
jgi:hypothetical protein